MNGSIGYFGLVELSLHLRCQSYGVFFTGGFKLKFRSTGTMERRKKLFETKKET
jgi:hypothetical protein